MTLKHVSTALYLGGLVISLCGLWQTAAFMTIVGAVLLGFALAVDAIVIEREREIDG